MLRLCTEGDSVEHKRSKMRVAWCTEHRGVMRVAFNEVAPKHFYNPCPRCGNTLNYYIWKKEEIDIIITIEGEITEDGIRRIFREGHHSPY